MSNIPWSTHSSLKFGCHTIIKTMNCSLLETKFTIVDGNLHVLLTWLNLHERNYSYITLAAKYK